MVQGHGFAPPKAALPAARAKKQRGVGATLLIIFGILIGVGGLGAGAVMLYLSLQDDTVKKITAELPDWAPVFPNGQITNSQIVDVGKGPSDGSVTQVTSEPVENVFNFYRTAIKRKGLTVTALSNLPERFVLEAKASDGARKLIVTGQATTSGAETVMVLSTRHTDREPPVPGDVLPEYFPLLAGSTVIQQVTRAKGAGAHGVIKFETTQPVAAILDFYESNIKARNLVAKREATSISAEAGEKKLGQVLVTSVGSKQQVSLIVSEPEK
jgi:hypothetical protein